MPNSDAKPIGYYPQHFVQALEKARLAPGTWVNVETELSERAARATYIKLTAMRAGLREFECEASLKEAAMTKRIKLSNPAVKFGQLRSVRIMYEERLERPSEAAARAFKEFSAGLRSTPF